MAALSWVGGAIFTIGFLVACYASGKPRDVSGEQALDVALLWWIGVVIMAVGCLVWLIRFGCWFFAGW
jgi:hypothetical protein